MHRRQVQTSCQPRQIRCELNRFLPYDIEPYREYPWISLASNINLIQGLSHEKKACPMSNVVPFSTFTSDAGIKTVPSCLSAVIAPN